jgi:transketolase
MLRVAPNLLKSEKTIEHHASQLEISLAVAARFARRHAIAAIHRAGVGDCGASLACTDLLACLYGAELNLWPSTVSDPDRDRFVLSHAGAVPALYAVGAHFRFCDADAALDFCRLGSKFQPHPAAGTLAYIDASTGSPGHGFSLALGMALGLKLQRRPSRVYALLSEGELETGQAWEAALCAPRHRLDNLCVVVECSRNPGDATRSRLEPLPAKWRAFDWAVAEIDGHSISQILSAFRRAGMVHDRPAVILAYTVRGKGVPALENAPVSRTKLSDKEAAEALSALGTSHKEISELLHAR